MSATYDDSPNIPSYEEFKQRLVDALNTSSSNWSKKDWFKKMNDLRITETEINKDHPVVRSMTPSEPPSNRFENLQPYRSRIYQRRQALRQILRQHPYSQT